MKRLLDINTWIALTVETHPHHVAARKWYDETALTAGDLTFCLPTELGFLRLITQAAVMNQCGAAPLTNVEAKEFLTSVYRDPGVSRADEPWGMRTLWWQLADRPTPSPNVWLDANLAAFALALGSRRNASGPRSRSLYPPTNSATGSELPHSRDERRSR
jgi:toxin-antitoxin system PIN domain toxin